MMKINKLLASMVILPAVATMLTACSDIEQEAMKKPADENGILFLAPGVSLPEGEGNQDLNTRATYYDGQKGGVYFDWKEGEVVGIFPIVAEGEQMKYECKTVNTSAADAGDGISKAYFRQEVADFSWTVGLNYRSYYPYIADATITAVPLDYTGQQQTGKPDMENYFNGDKANYYATEKTASKHLSEKSFLLSAETQPEENKPLGFKMNHIGGIVRFYLALPATINASISEVRLVATKAVFHEQATLNVQTGETTPTGEPTNNLVLKVTDVTLPGTTYGNYLVAYMMAYPVALTSNAVLGTTGKLYIYVKGNDGAKDVYFRSGALTKKDITAGVLTQFSVKPTEKDDPIDVQPITVEEWQEGLTLDNDGTGTGNW